MAKVETERPTWLDDENEIPPYPVLLAPDAKSCLATTAFVSVLI